MKSNFWFRSGTAEIPRSIRLITAYLLVSTGFHAWLVQGQHSLLINGGFETPDVTVSKPRYFTQVSTTGLTGWSITGPPTFALGLFNGLPNVGGISGAAEGKQFLIFNPGPNPSQVKISQTFTTHAGFTYVAGFQIGRSGNPNFKAEMTVRIAEPDGTIVKTFQFSPPSNGWGVTNTFRFVAKASSLTIIFADTSPQSDILSTDLALDNITVTELIPQRASATAQVVNGYLVGVNIINAGLGYDTPPEVIVSGGGGGGAIVSSVISDGEIVGFSIINNGHGYTSEPVIKIASPPFVPQLALRVKTVAVEMKVVLGRKYHLESSFDASNWLPAGIPFVAQDEMLIVDFDVESSGRFFRLNQVP